MSLLFNIHRPLFFTSILQSFYIISICIAAAASSLASTSNLTSNYVWDDLIFSCSASVTFDCVQNSLHKSLERTLDGDFSVTDSIQFTRNNNSYNIIEVTDNNKQDNINNTSSSNNNVDDDDDGYEEFINSVEHSEADLEGGTRKPRLISRPRSVDGISDILYNRGVHYLMTHTFRMQLPELMFGGGTVNIEPKSIEDDGAALVRIKFEEPVQSEGRIFLKKIKQVFKKKLMSSFMAAMLVIKLVKMKLIFLLPLIFGVTTAKKILLKVLLFLFPALAHLFKLCAYYHHQHTKYHLHHHHQVSHHHHHPAPTIYVPPPSHHEEYHDYPPPGAEIIHRAEPAANNELSSWGIDYQGPPETDHINRLYTVNRRKAGGSKNKKRYRTRYKHGRPHRRRKRPHLPRIPPHINEINNDLTSTADSGLPIQATAPLHLEDPFYSPILTKLDRVFLELGFTEEPCKERLVCSMYKAPERFSPHSNLVSAEISRDPSELQKPLFANPAVVRYFRYVQAARNGQDLKDCLALYPACSLLTE